MSKVESLEVKNHVGKSSVLFYNNVGHRPETAWNRIIEMGL